jgi:hypothetical protein
MNTREDILKDKNVFRECEEMRQTRGARDPEPLWRREVEGTGDRELKAER